MASNETHEMKRSIWLARFKEKEDSGLTVDQYCEQIGCNPKSYYYWRKVIRREVFDSVSPVTELSVPVPVQTPAFAELKEPVPSNNSSSIIMHFGEARIELPDTVSEELLVKILRAVSHA